MVLVNKTLHCVRTVFNGASEILCNMFRVMIWLTMLAYRNFMGAKKCNHYAIGIELEGCDFEPFESAQYDALLVLLDELCQHYPINAITGHQHIAPHRKTDPGHFF